MDTPDLTRPAEADTVSGRERAFPALTEKQVARIATHGRRRSTTRGEVLVEVGDRAVPFFVVVTGEIEAVRPSEGADTLIVRHQSGHFSGEANMITGRRAIARLQVSEPGEVIELNRDELLALIQTDAELSEILMRAFIMRRLSSDCPRSRRRRRHRIDAQCRNASRERIPDAERPSVSLPRSGSRPRGAGAARPVSDRRLRDPRRDLPRQCRAAQSDERADCRLPRLQRGHRSTPAWSISSIVGAGPAGLAAAVYGASEGLDVLVLESSFARRSGRVQLTNRKLPGLPDRHLGARADRPRVRAGAEVRRARDGGQWRHTTGVRRPAIHRRYRRRPSHPSARGHHRERSGVPQAGAASACQRSRARASTTARHPWRPGSASARTWRSSAAATLPGRPPCFSRRPRGGSTCWSAAPAWLTRCRAT